MLHTLTIGPRPASDAVLRDMFAARKSVFVDLLKWDVPVIGGAFEVDEFDDAHARYLVLARPDGRHLGSARLLPTTRPHILSSFYAGLCEGAPPSAPDVYEISRFCLDRRLTARERRGVRDTLVCALVDHALGTGISAYSAVAGIGWYQQVLGFGWRCTPLGMPALAGATRLAALRIDIGADTPARLAAAGIAPSASPGGDASLAA